MPKCFYQTIILFVFDQNTPDFIRGKGVNCKVLSWYSVVRREIKNSFYWRREGLVSLIHVMLKLLLNSEIYCDVKAGKV